MPHVPADFRTRAPSSAFWTEVSCPVPLRASVPKPSFLRFGRKFRSLYLCGLPYQGPVFTILDGSFMACAPADFRTGGLFAGFWTEVSCPMYLRTSVPEPPFRHFGRILDGSFMPHVPADFRTRAPFSMFWTEVSCPMYLLTSVPVPRFQHFGRMFHAPCTCWLPYQGPLFCILDGSRSSQLLLFTTTFPCISLYF